MSMFKQKKYINVNIKQNTQEFGNQTFYQVRRQDFSKAGYPVSHAGYFPDCHDVIHAVYVLKLHFLFEFANLTSM